MILHFLTKDKFCGYALRQFSEAQMSSDFVLIGDAGDTLEDGGRRVPSVAPGTDEFASLVGSLGKYRAIVLHGLFWPWQEDVLRNVPDSVKVAWVFWGGDIYGRSDVRKDFLSRRSRCLLALHRTSGLLKGKKETEKYDLPKELLHRIDYCLTDIPEDLEFFNRYIGKEVKSLWYNYYSIEQTVGPLSGCRCRGSNVLLGNSATLECNHADVFRTLRKSKSFDKVVVPLSYGSPWVRNMISGYGKAVMGARFEPLTSFLPLEEYNRILLGCSCVIMPHHRPQAFGNIITSLWLGCRVYMSKKSILFAFFKRNGFLIHSIEDDLREHQDFSPLSEEEMSVNRAILESLYSVEAMNLKNIEIVRALDA